MIYSDISCLFHVPVHALWLMLLPRPCIASLPFFFRLPAHNRHRFCWHVMTLLGISGLVLSTPRPLLLLRRQPQRQIQPLPKLLELGHALAQVVVLEVAACLGILVLAVRVLIKVDALEVVEVEVVDVGLIVFIYFAALVFRKL